MAKPPNRGRSPRSSRPISIQSWKNRHPEHVPKSSTLQKGRRRSIAYWKRLHPSERLSPREFANLLNMVFTLVQRDSARVLTEGELLRRATKILRLRKPLTKQWVFAVFDAAEDEMRAKPKR